MITRADECQPLPMCAHPGYTRTPKHNKHYRFLFAETHHRNITPSDVWMYRLPNGCGAGLPLPFTICTLITFCTLALPVVTVGLYGSSYFPPP